MSIPDAFHCVCGCSWSEARSQGYHCWSCGRIWTIYTNGERSWQPGYAEKQANRIIDMGRGHFERIHKDMRRLDRKLEHLGKQLKIKFKKGRPKNG